MDSLLQHNKCYQGCFQKLENNKVSPGENHEFEEIVQMNNQVYSIGFDGKQNLTGELSHQSANLFSDTVSLLQ